MKEEEGTFFSIPHTPIHSFTHTQIHTHIRIRIPFCLVAGYVLLIENTRSSNPILGYYQDITASAAASMGGKGPFPVLCSLFLTPTPPLFSCPPFFFF
jgi:hypothetical protein